MAGGWSARARMSGPLVPYMEGFEVELGRMGYAPGSVAHHARLVAALDRWLEQRCLDGGALTPEVVGQFMEPRRAAGMHMRTPKALQPFLDHLRGLGVTPVSEPACAVSSVERLLERYRRHLIVERGIAASTAAGYVFKVRPFLEAHDRSRRLELGQLCATDVTTFVVASCRERRGREVVTAMRSLLRFLHLVGVIDEDLAAAVPSVARWRLSGLPQALAPGQARLLVESCDRSIGIGARDFAILTVLTRLGLRVGEVAAMLLDDIDWRAGEITVRNGKRGRLDPLPLPVDVGEAIAEYLRSGRPAHATTRCVFVRTLAPATRMTGPGVAAVVAAACDRIGIDPIGAHRLRHTAATEMLRAGAGLEEIGQVLRHRLAITTAIYAKVDRDALQQLARPWPGGAS